MEALSLSNASLGLWPDRNSPAIIVANHSSYFDAPWIAARSPRPILFGADPDFATRKPWSVLLAAYASLVHCEMVPMSPGHVLGLRNMLARLKAGGWVCLFPEGGISTGIEWGGADWLAAKSGATIHTLRLRTFGYGKFRIPYSLRPVASGEFQQKTLTA